MSESPMERLYRRLEEAGFKRDYILDHVLPDWWDDAAANTPAGLAEAQSIIADKLGLDQKALWSGNEHLPLFLMSDEAKRKLQKGIESARRGEVSVWEEDFTKYLEE